MVEKTRQQEQGVAGHIVSLVEKQKKMKAGSPHFLFLTQFRTQVMVLPTFEVDLPTSI